MKKIYLDHSATTPVDPEVVSAMKPYFSEKYGNASTFYSMGLEAKKALELARKQVANVINADPSEIIFTSGGTESDNLAIKGVVKKGDHIITSVIEHPAVLNTCKYFQTKGVEVTFIPVNEKGIIKLDELKKSVKKNTKLISIMHVNSEIGTIQPIEEIAKLCKSKKILFHTDAVQSFGKIPINVKKTPIDMLSVSSHKLYGPKGVGCLYVRKGVKIIPQLHGGGHENKIRAGTENVAGIVGFGKACELVKKNMNSEAKRLSKLRDKLIKQVLKIPNSFLNGDSKKRLPGNAHFGFRYIEGESLILRLDDLGFEASTGSACSSKSLEPSHVLLAIGLSHEASHGSLRITLGRYTKEADINKLISVIPKVVEDLRKISPLGK